MIIPKFWAEQLGTVDRNGKTINIRRFGWSDLSQEDANSNAEVRLFEAIERIRSGENLKPKERRVGYDGSEGVPIREEIIESHEQTVVTRNAYGARCLNSPNVLLADIDFPTQTSCQLILVVTVLLVALALVVAWQKGSLMLAILLVGLAVGLGHLIAWAIGRSLISSRGGEQEMALDRIRKFVERDGDWSIRVYRTPLGLRAMVTHRLFDTREDDVTRFFHAIGSDPIYVRMCMNQACFRARVSGKPWRMGVEGHILGGVWPVSAQFMPRRIQWVERYEEAAKNFAACEYVETIGSGSIDGNVRPVLELHDMLCQVGKGLALA